jgi:hypothetical protein
VEGEAGDSETDTVTAYGEDEEGNSVNASDSATVTVTNATPSITLDKEAVPTEVYEPGENVTYTYEVTNQSTFETVTITSLLDDIYGQLASTCNFSPLGPLASQTCTITRFVGGDPGDGIGQGFDFLQNVATVSGIDDDGEPVTPATDDALVNILDVAPTATLTKDVTQMAVTYQVVVTNTSSAESLTLEYLWDNQFGDITYAHPAGDGYDEVKSTDCSTGTIPPGGFLQCEFVGIVTESPHIDTVSGTISDNEGTQIYPSDSAQVTFGDPAP